MDMISYTNANSAPTLQSILRTSAMNAESQMPSHISSIPGPLPGYTCLFSQLSGEMRNRIYDYILEDEPASMIWVNYKPNPAMPFQERYSKHQYMGLTQVDRKTRTEFAPLYVNGRYFHFSQLRHFYRSGLAGKNDAYTALISLLSTIKKGYRPAVTEFDSPNPGLDVTLLFRLDPYTCDVTGRWFLDTGYKTYKNSLTTGVLCRMLACLPSWHHLLEPPGPITKISILKSRYRSGKPFILVTVELDSEIEASRAAVVHALVERALVAELDFSMPDSGPAASHNFLRLKCVWRGERCRVRRQCMRI